MSTLVKSDLKFNGKAVVCLSGGQDSTTCLFWAKEKFKEGVEAVTFDYGQHHNKEKAAVKKVAEVAQVPLTVLSIPALREIGGGALTNEKDFQDKEHIQFKNLPSTFVPLRNLILFGTAAAYAIKKDIYNLVVGICQTDYSGYPDCRQSFVNSLEQAIWNALDLPVLGFSIHAPLMSLTKADTVRMCSALDGCFHALAYTHTCYNNEYPPCGKCPACELRAKGFKESGYEDPLITRATGKQSETVPPERNAFYISRVIEAECHSCKTKTDLRFGVCYECAPFVKTDGNIVWDERHPEKRWKSVPPWEVL